VLEVDPASGRAEPLLDDSPLLPGLQMNFQAAMARLLILPDQVSTQPVLKTDDDVQGRAQTSSDRIGVAVLDSMTRHSAYDELAPAPSQLQLLEASITAAGRERESVQVLPVSGNFNGKDRAPPKSDEQRQLSNTTLQWWRWVVTRVANQAGWIPLNDTTGLRESFVKTWDPDLFDWGGDFRWQAGEWARLRGLPVAAATQFEYETAFWGLSYNNTKPNIVNTTWGRDSVSHDVDGKPVPASGVWPHMTQAAPLWHLACQQGTARIGLLGDSVTQDNSAGNLNGRDFTGGFGFWENTRFIESAVGRAAGVNTTFSIRNHVNQLRRVQGLHGDPLVRDPILSAFIHFTYSLWLKSWADLHSSTLRLAANAGRTLPPAVYGNIGHKCKFTLTLCLVCYRLALHLILYCLQIRCLSLWNQHITMYIGLNPSCTWLRRRSSPRIILESAPQLR
jgi:hypothetical protein